MNTNYFFKLLSYNMEIIIGVLALLVTFLGVMFALTQNKLSKRQLKLSLFDKYFKFFIQSDDFLVNIMMGWVSNEECSLYYQKMKEAEFLLEPELNTFISKIHEIGMQLSVINNDIIVYERNANSLTEENQIERKKLMSQKSDLLKMIPPLRDELKEKFNKHLNILE